MKASTRQNSSPSNPSKLVGTAVCFALAITSGVCLVAHIPRMQGVAEMIGHQRDQCYDPSQVNFKDKTHTLAIGSQILRVCIDLENLIQTGCSTAQAIDQMRAHPKPYDPRILDHAQNAPVQNDTDHDDMVRSIIDVRDLKEGMILDEPLCTRNGMLLLAKDLVVSQTVVERVHNHLRTASLSMDQKIRVFMPTPRQIAA